MSPLFPLIVVILLGPIVSAGRAAEVTVRIKSDATVIRAWDPLAIEISVINGRRSGIVIDPRFGVEYGTFLFERATRDGDFEPMRLPMQGAYSPVVLQPRYLRPNSGMFGYALLWRTESDFVFPTDGTYRIRAKVALGDTSAAEPQSYFYSEPIDVNVRPLPDGEQKAIAENVPLLSRALQPFPDLDQPTIANINSFLSTQSSNNIARVLRNSVFVAEIKGAPTKDANEVLTDIQKTGEVTSILLNYALADRYLQLDEVGLAQQALKRVPAPSERWFDLSETLRCKLAARQPAAGRHKTKAHGTTQPGPKKGSEGLCFNPAFSGILGSRCNVNASEISGARWRGCRQKARVETEPVGSFK